MGMLRTVLGRRPPRAEPDGPAPSRTPPASLGGLLLRAIRACGWPLDAGGVEVGARIRRHDPLTEAERRRRGEASWYHRARARRALDRGDWAAAERHAHRALGRDDAHAGNFLALGEALLRRAPADPAGARRALERAQALRPADGYILGRLLDAYGQLGDAAAAAHAVRSALAAGAPAVVWAPELRELEGPARAS